MNDQDRGAYTPGGERPLAFDARGPSGGGMGGGGGRGPVPLALIGSAGVLVVVVVGLVLAYRGGGHGGGAPHEVGQPVGAMKVAAAAGGQPAESSAGSDVYAAQNVPASKPSFAPPPEAPAPRPAPQVAAKGLTVRTVDPAKVRMEPADEPAPTAAAKVASATAATAVRPGAADQAASTTKVAKAAAEPVVTTRTAKATAQSAKPDVATKIATAKPAVTKTVEAASTKVVSASGAAVQIGAFSSRALADKGWSDVASLMSGRMSGHGKAVEGVDRDGKTLFRTTVTGFADKEAAKTFCLEMQGKGHTCIVKG